MIRLDSYIAQRWVSGGGKPAILVNPSTEAPMAEVLTEGLDVGAALDAARAGGATLRKMSFAERGALLKAMSRALHAAREELLDLEQQNNGATRGDAKFDIDGATGTLAAYASLGEELGARSFLLDGDERALGRGARFVGQHVRLPRPGVAVQINAFNFPGWGTFEKVAVALLAGVPVISKPATATALVAWRMVRIVTEQVELPPGALQLIVGSTGELLDLLGPHDVVAFTGSAGTASRLRAGAAFTERSARFNAEADSLNAAVLGPDVGPGDPIWNLAVRNIVQDMTQKTGQKCTAVRRILVPEARLGDLREALVEELGRVRVGDTAHDQVTMGPVATAAQLRDVRAGIQHLAAQAEIALGGPDPLDGLGAPEGRGYFVRPTLLVARDPASADRVHQHEVFGPCATLLPYDGSAERASALVALGQGSLVSAVYSDDKGWLGESLLSLAVWNGRVLVASEKVSDQTTPPGMVLPTLVHGGPGRAGGGEELGGTRGMELYTQRVALQGDTGMLKRLLGKGA